jgi:hypothetical protein
MDFLGQIVIEIFFGLTGHAVLWAVTFGRWSSEAEDTKAKANKDSLASFVGFLFWAAIAAGVWFLFFRRR